MKIRRNLTYICAVTLMAGLGLIPPSLAQYDHGSVDNRLLLIFDTSSAMKKRLAAEDKAINELVAIALNGQLRPGDTVGVWTFNRDLHTGEFPLLHWTDSDLTTFPQQLIEFLKKERYTKNTRFDALMPTLNQVVRTSPRLTVIIFCDGDGKVTDIPGSDAINDSFKQHYRQMEKGRVPFVIVLRSQIGPDGIGNYVGCTISSAESITLPHFPRLLPSPPSPAQAEPVPTPPAPVTPSLIIIGTNNPATNQPQPSAASPQRQPRSLPVKPARPNTPTAPVPPAPSPAPSVPLSDTNFVPPPAAPMQPTNAAIVPPQAPAPKPPVTAAQAMPPETAGTNTDGLIAAGAGLLIVAIAILFFILRRARGRNSASLITESLKKDKIHS